MPNGGRPIYTEDFLTLQNGISFIERMLSMGGNNCVLSGCEYEEDEDEGWVCVQEGYVIIQRNLCHVDSVEFENFNFTNDYPLYIEMIEEDSVERVQLKNGETCPLTTIKRARVVKKSNASTRSISLSKYSPYKTSGRYDRFYAFYDTYPGFAKKAEASEVAKRAYIVDLSQYVQTNSVLPTINAVFVYGNNHITHHRTMSIPESEDSKFGGLAKGNYFVFCVRHDFEHSDTGNGSDFFLYNSTRRFVAAYNESNVIECILEAFGENVATSDHDGRMTKEQVRLLGSKADRNYVNNKLAEKANSADVYDKSSVDSFLNEKLDRSTWEEDKDILWGEIKIWAGKNGTLSEKYHLCDGSYFPIPTSATDPYHDLFQIIGTSYNTQDTPGGNFALPNLSGRFIVGSGTNSNNETFNFKASGGAATVTLTTEQIPSHNHVAKFHATEDDNGHLDEYGVPTGINPATVFRSDVITVENTGGGKPHNNLPPYYVLAYVIRVSK